jgi:hypothetical protein
MLGPSAPTASKPRSTGSRDTRASPGTKRLTARQTKHKKTEATQYASEYTPRPRIELDRSPKGERRRRRSGRPTSLQTLRRLTEGQSWAQEIRPNDKREIIGNKVLQTEERACAYWNVPKAVWTPRGRQMLVVRKQNATDAGASLPPLQPVERPADSALEGGGKGHGMESGQMPACANL